MAQIDGTISSGRTIRLQLSLRRSDNMKGTKRFDKITYKAVVESHLGDSVSKDSARARLCVLVKRGWWGELGAPVLAG